MKRKLNFFMHATCTSALHVVAKKNHLSFSWIENSQGLKDVPVGALGNFINLKSL